MRWKRRGRSVNLEDRRGQRPRRIGVGGGGARLGVGGILVLLVLSLVFKQDFLSLLGAVDTGAVVPSTAPVTLADEEPLVEFVSFVLDDAQGVWSSIFAGSGAQYREAKLVLFRDAVQSACGFAQAATGPFYCPGDHKVYIDLGFYDELRSRFGAPGDFAQAYVLAHEIGHHVQNLLGTEAEMRRAQRAQPQLRNEFSVRMELQADCYAGIWAYSTAQRDLLERGDVEEGLGAAAAVGDDRIQQRSSGYINLDAFTHGSSEQRVGWFRQGLQSGDPNVCDTFTSNR